MELGSKDIVEFYLLLNSSLGGGKVFPIYKGFQGAL